MAFPATGIAGSKKLSIVNDINVYSSRLYTIIFSNIVIPFFTLISLWVKL